MFRTPVDELRLRECTGSFGPLLVSIYNRLNPTMGFTLGIILYRHVVCNRSRNLVILKANDVGNQLTVTVLLNNKYILFSYFAAHTLWVLSKYLNSLQLFYLCFKCHKII